MALTISENDLFAKYVTGEAVASVGMRYPLVAFFRGSGGITGVEYLRNSQNEDTFANTVDAQNAWNVQSTLPT